MPNWLFIVFSVCVAALVGGVTNHFAIKMLFHPREPVRIGRWRVPFTPGLIPKRREDIAASLGEVVSEYLVTSDGLRVMLDRPDVRERAVQAVTQYIEAWLKDERTVKQWTASLFPNEEWDELKLRLASRLDRLTEQGLTSWLTAKGWDERPLSEWIPIGTEESRQRMSDNAAAAVLHSLQKELTSLQGQRMLTRMAKEVIDRAQGFFGAMAAIFVDEDKLVSRMSPVIIEQLQSPAVQAAVSQFISGKLAEWVSLPPAQLVRAWADLKDEEDAMDFVIRKLQLWIQWDQRLERLAEVRPAQWLDEVKSAWMPYVPRIVNGAITLIDRNLDQIVRAARLEEVVRSQVEQFPVERLETIILSVSGKEFRAITWLGALLGGIIGLFQSFVLLAVG
ncbi:DUF445 family protein [Paenibacillus sp. OSY-SE]|uniref:DUF445 family protein n=1 Tax=Paenibacillus sp. OSY-SE TaxID=1196323 RepID=UPI000315DD87|nr:DUF445 family protein [Paenibacillus sp. OSY-SE]